MSIFKITLIAALIWTLYIFVRTNQRYKGRDKTPHWTDTFFSNFILFPFGFTFSLIRRDGILRTDMRKIRYCLYKRTK